MGSFLSSGLEVVAFAIGAIAVLALIVIGIAALFQMKPRG